MLKGLSVILLGGQAVVKPVELVLPSYQVPCETPDRARGGAWYSGATAAGSELGDGMAVGLLHGQGRTLQAAGTTP